MSALRWVRDLVGKSKHDTQPVPETPSQLPQGTELGIWHLRHLLGDYKKLSQVEKDSQLRKMIPLFCKVFSDRANELSLRLPEAKEFAVEVSKTLVGEIQQRAINRSAKQACLIIAEYLEDHSQDAKPSQADSEGLGTDQAATTAAGGGAAGAGATSAPAADVNDGWNMLQAVRLLAESMSPDVLTALAKSGLPSTLTKCLYLFFDLPPLPPLPPLDPDTNKPRPSDLFVDTPGSPVAQLDAAALGRLKTVHNRRVLLHAEFTKALVASCQSVSSAEDITNQDDLCRLFGIVTTFCPVHCRQWRKLSSDVLICVARCSLSPAIVNYVHRRSCISLCVRNMNKCMTEGVGPLELIEMMVTLSCFVKDASESSYVLLDDFRTSQGYRFLSDFLLRIEVSAHDDAMGAMRNMVLLVSNLTKTGFVELQPPKLDGSPFQAKDFVMPKPSGTDSVRNILAFQVLQSSFMKARTQSLCLRIVEIIFNIFSSDPANFFILEHQQTLSCFVERMHEKSIPVQEHVLKLVEYVVCSLNYIPCPSLVSMSITLKGAAIPTVLTIMILLNKLVNFDEKFRDIFRDLSLLDSIIYNLEQFSVSAYFHAKQEHRLEVAVGKDNLGMRPMSPAVTSGQMTPVKGDGELVERAKKDAATLEQEAMQQAIGRWKCSSIDSLSDDVDTTGSSSPSDLDNVLTTEECLRQSVSCLCTLLLDSPQNVSVFRTNDGLNILERMVEVPGLARSLALQIYSHLITTCDTGDEEMSALLGLLQTLPPAAVEVKTAILQCIQQTFVRHGDRTRAMFRNVSGFAYVINVAASMSDSLQQPPPASWQDVKHSDVLTLVRHIIALMTEVMSEDVANMYILHQWTPQPNFNHSSLVSSQTLTSALRLLGCFAASVQELPHYTAYQCETLDEAAGEPLSLSPSELQALFRRTSLYSAAEVLGCVYAMSMGRHINGSKDTKFYSGEMEEESGYRGWALPTSAGDLMYPFAALAMMEMLASLQPDHDQSASAVSSFLDDHLRARGSLAPRTCAQTTAGQAVTEEETGGVSSGDRQQVATRKRLNRLSMSRRTNHSVAPTVASHLDDGVEIVSSGPSQVLSEPHLKRVTNVLMIKWCQRLQERVANVLCQVITSETNQQRLCAADLLPLLLSSCRLALACEEHPLHQCSLRAVERLASQAMTAADLREFLRLGNPLNCSLHDSDALRARCGPLPQPLENTPEPSPLSSKRNLAVADLADVTTDSQVLLHHPATTASEDTANDDSVNPGPFVPTDLPGCELLGRRVPLSRIQSLVSLATPRSSSSSTTICPPYIEFKMSADGYGCIMAPPIAVNPTFASSPSPLLVSAISSFTSISTLSCSSQAATPNYRQFPPAAGLSVSAWVYIESFSSPLADAHPLRLLSLVRSQQLPDKPNRASVCLSITLSARDRMLIVSTSEVDAIPPSSGSGNGGGAAGTGETAEGDADESDVIADSSHHARFFCTGLTHTGAWHHLSVVLSNPLLKGRTVSVYMDGELVKTKKLSYIHHQMPGMASYPIPTDVTTTNSLYPVLVHAIFGTRRCQKRCSALQWRLGPAHIIDEPLTATIVKSIFDLGPCYMGSFQAPYGVGERESEGTVSSSGALIGEDKISFGLNSLSYTDMALDDLLASGGERDGMKFLKEELQSLGPLHSGMPMRIFHNTALHLTGPGRSFGGVVLGNFLYSVRCFYPQPVSTIIGSVGGIHLLLGLVAQATDVQMLYAAVKALVCVITTNAGIMLEMEKTGGFQVLAMLLQRRRRYLNTHILHLTFSLVGTVDSNSENTVIPHPTAFCDLLGDLQFWMQTSEDIQRTLLVHFFDLVMGCSESAKNIETLRGMQMVERMMDILLKDNTSMNIAKYILNVVAVLLRGFPSSSDLLCFGQFLMSTLPESSGVQEESPDTTVPESTELDEHAALRQHKKLQQTVFTSRLDDDAPSSTPESSVAEHPPAEMIHSNPDIAFIPTDNSTVARGGSINISTAPISSKSRSLSVDDLLDSGTSSPMDHQKKFFTHSVNDVRSPPLRDPVSAGRAANTGGHGSITQFVKNTIESAADGFTAATRFSPVGKVSRMAYGSNVSNQSFCPMAVPLHRTEEFEKDVPSRVAKRNLLLDFLEHTLRLDSLEVDVVSATAVADVLGLDWLLLFMHVHIHRSTVVRALRVLSVLVAVPALRTRFTLGMVPGLWSCKAGNEHATLSQTHSMSRVSRHSTIDLIPGYAALTSLLKDNGATFQILYIMFAILINTPVVRIPTFMKEFTPKSLEGTFDITLVDDPFASLIVPVDEGAAPPDKPRDAFTIGASRGPLLSVNCCEMSLVLLSLVRAMMNAEPGTDLADTPHSHPSLVIQGILAVYMRSLELSMFAVTQPFLSALVACLFVAKPEPERRAGMDEEEERSDDDDEEFVVIDTRPVATQQKTSSNSRSSEGGNMKTDVMCSLMSAFPPVAQSTGLTSHPASKEVLKLLAAIALDSLLLCGGGDKAVPSSSATATASTQTASMSSSSSKANIETVDLILELINNASPSAAISSNVQGVILSMLMGRLAPLKPLVSTSLFSAFRVAENQAVPMSSAGHRPLAKFVAFCGRLADKAWQGVFGENVIEVLSFLVSLISDALVAKTTSKVTSPGHRFFSSATSPKSKSLKAAGHHHGLQPPPGSDTASRCNSIFRSINRLILFSLSHHTNSMTCESANVQVLLEWIIQHHRLVFHASNKDVEFLACAVHHLLTLCQSGIVSGHQTAVSISQQASATLPVSSVVSSSPPSGASTVQSQLKSPAQESPRPAPNVVSTTSTASSSLFTPQAGRDSFYSASLTGNLAPGVLVGKFALMLWPMLVSARKKDLCDIFKIQDAAGLPASLHSPELVTATRSLLAEQDVKIWQAYLATEDKFQDAQGAALAAGKSAFRRKGMFFRRAKSDDRQYMEPKQLDHMLLVQSCSHLASVRTNVVLKRHNLEVTSAQINRYALQEWRRVEGELLRERGIWGPNEQSTLSKWRLDLMEGPGRMRKRLVLNEQFYSMYPYRPPQDKRREVPGKNKFARSGDSKDYYHYYVNGENHVKIFESLLTRGVGGGSGGGGADSTDLSGSTASVRDTDDTSTQGLDDTLTSETAHSLLAAAEKLITKDRAGSDPGRSTERVPTLPISQGSNEATEFGQGQIFSVGKGQDVEDIVLKALDHGDRVRFTYRCLLVNGLDIMDGVLVFSTHAFYILLGLSLLPSGRIVQMTSPEAQHLPDVVPKQRRNKPSISLEEEQVFSLVRCSYEDLKEIYRRRYCLVNCAIEVFQGDGHSHFLALSKTEQPKVYQRFISLAKHLDDPAEESLLGMKRDAEVESSSLLNSLIHSDKKVTDRWLRDEINNFQYLMYLNTIAGRSYNDLMQYPIFPWILADYTSEVLDLTDPKSFRDLSKPMGAQTPNRLKQFSQRYRDWEDPAGTKPYYYGTHYSSAMIVSSYLIRLEPFTQHFLRLQGGHFDHADRMFHSMKDQWASASEINMADIKELIPEFFYLPDFLQNKSRFKLGVKQNGDELDNVILPPWAKGDAHEFIRVHREALECDYITSHIHEWIDLIFGYKQQGPASVEAHNVFHHLFYEGAVNIDDIQDDLEKNATIAFINNFGQMPKQLFKRPHPPKKVKSRPPLSTQSTIDSVSVSMSNSTLPGSSATLTTSAAGSAATDRLFYRNLHRLQPSLQPIKELQGPVGCIVQSEKDRSVICVERNRVLVPPMYNRYLSWGFPDFSLRAGSLESDKAVTAYEGLHTGQITCVVCPDPKTVITGGESTVLCVWQLVSSTGKEKSRQLALKEVLYGHSAPITCLQASTSYSIIVSAAQDGTCFIWDLQRLTFIRQLKQHDDPVEAICINALTGDIVTCAGCTLSWWSINGDLLARERMPSGDSHAMTCCAMSELCVWDCENVIVTGSMDGVVRFWSLGFHDQHYSAPPHQDLMRLDTTMSDASASVSPSTSTINSPAAKPLTRTVSPFFKTKIGGHTLDNPTLNRASPVRRASADITGTSRTTSDGLVKPALSLSSMTSATSEYGAVAAGANMSAQSIGTDGDIHPPAYTISQPGLSTDGLSRSGSMGSVGGVPATGMSRTVSQDSFAASPTQPPLLLSEDGAENKAKDGPRWKRRLILRGRLTMHTAFDRVDNKFPAAITSLHISKDHRRLLVGDYRGRIYSWSVPETHGKVADHWVPDDVADFCSACRVKFSMTERRHHCRNCGKVFCGKCSKYESEIPEMRIMRAVRVCEACYIILRGNLATPIY